MQILADVDPIRIDFLEKLLEGGSLLGHSVTAVVDQDIDPRDIARERAKELTVGLIADDDLDPVFFKLLDVRVDVYTPDPCPLTKIMLPHLKRSSLVHTDLDQIDFGIAKSGQVALVDIEVVHPLVDHAAGIVEKISFEIVHFAKGSDDGSETHCLLSYR